MRYGSTARISIPTLGFMAAAMLLANEVMAWEVKDLIGTWEGKAMFAGASQSLDCSFEIWEEDGDLDVAIETAGFVVFPPRVEFADDVLTITVREFPEKPENNSVMVLNLDENKVLKAVSENFMGTEVKFVGIDDQIPVADEDLAGVYTGVIRQDIALNAEGTETKKQETEVSVVIAVEGELIGARVSGVKNRLESKVPFEFDVLKIRRNGNRLLLQCRLNEERSKNAVKSNKIFKDGSDGAIMGKITHSSFQASVQLPWVTTSRMVLIKQ